MEYASYETLDQILKMKGKVSEYLASMVFKQIAKGLECLHQN
jgi:serine/threonine protein kinase